MPVPLEDLPVELPKLTNFKGEGQSPLAHADDWLHVKCPRFVSVRLPLKLH